MRPDQQAVFAYPSRRRPRTFREKSAACPRTGGRCARSGEEAIADRPSHARPSTAIAAAAMRAPATASHEAATRKARRKNYNGTAALGSCLRAVLEEAARWLGYEALDRSRQVIALCGGFNMLMGEFLTASQHQLPVKVVVYNNSCFGLIPLEAEAAGLPRFREGVEFPNPDFVDIQGREAERAQKRDPRSARLRRLQAVRPDAPVACKQRAPRADRRSSMRLSPPTRCRTCRISTSPWLGASRWPRSRKRFSRRPAPDSSV